MLHPFAENLSNMVVISSAKPCFELVITERISENMNNYSVNQHILAK